MNVKSKTSIQTCQICQINDAIYCCPRCSIRTCSLSCCQKHKQMSNCNGKRDRTSYISLTKFTDDDLRSDFHFLEDVLHTSERVKRLGKELKMMTSKSNSTLTSKSTLTWNRKKNNNDRKDLCCDSRKDGQCGVDTCEKDDEELPLLLQTIPTMDDELQWNNEDPMKRQKKRRMNDNNWNSFSNGLKRLIKEAGNMERNVNLLLMPSGMEKRKNNSTSFSNKTKTIYWKVEWKLHNINESNCYISTLDRFSELSILETELKKHSDKFQKKIYPKDDIHLFIKYLPCVSNQPKYMKLSLNQNLQNALKNRTIIEYPTIEVVLTRDLSLFPTVIQSI